MNKEEQQQRGPKRPPKDSMQIVELRYVCTLRRPGETDWYSRTIQDYRVPKWEAVLIQKAQADSLLALGLEAYPTPE